MSYIKMLTRKKAIQQEINKKREEIRELERKQYNLKKNCNHEIMVIEYKETIDDKTINLCSKCLFCDFAYESYFSFVPKEEKEKLNNAIYIDACDLSDNLSLRPEEVENMYIRLKNNHKNATNKKIAKMIQDEIDSK